MLTKQLEPMPAFRFDTTQLVGMAFLRPILIQNGIPLLVEHRFGLVLTDFVVTDFVVTDFEKERNSTIGLPPTKQLQCLGCAAFSRVAHAFGKTNNF